MRRKSERTTAKKGKASPEKKVDKLKRTRSTKRRKHSSSSENESPEEESPAQIEETKIEPEQNPHQSQESKDNPEDAQDQVWRVKTAEGSGDVGEIQKLKICLTRPPSTPERVDRSPRSKRKQSCATSSSDTTSVEGVEEKKKPRHRKRILRGKDDSEKNDSQGEDYEADTEKQTDNEEKSSTEVSHSELTQDSVKDSEVPMSTTDEVVNIVENVPESDEKECKPKEIDKDNESQDKVLDADTTVLPAKEDTKDTVNENVTVMDVENQKEQSDEIKVESAVKIDEEKKSPERKRSVSEEKSEVLELHADESKCESFDEASQSKGNDKEEAKTPKEEAAKEQSSSEDSKVSIVEESVSNNSETIDTDTSKATNEPDVVVSPQTSKDTKDTTTLDKGNKTPDKTETEMEKSVPGVQHNRELQRSESVQSNQESVTNGQPTPVVGRKRRWGSRTTKLTTQKSITISTDVLKDIIPDVKPVEFDEVIEDKKHRREREVTEKVYRPILPKIVIDNTDNVEQKKEPVEKEQETKPRDLASNRKISIIKDNDSIIARPPSPPRNKQSCILYITNLVRPFTLTQLKNLLQRTGRIVDNGFWIDKIKSKCFVQYENEEQAVETRHALHGVTWPVSNPKTLQVDFSTEEAFEKAKTNEEPDTVPLTTKPGTVEDWLREQDMKRDRGEVEKPWERKAATREWDLGKNEKDKDKEKLRLDERPTDKRRRRSPEKSPEPARKFKKKEEEAPAKLLDDLFRKTKATPCIYWLPLSAETIAIKEQQRRQHMAEHERRLLELRRTHRRH